MVPLYLFPDHIVFVFGTSDFMAPKHLLQDFPLIFKGSSSGPQTAERPAFGPRLLSVGAVHWHNNSLYYKRDTHGLLVFENGGEDVTLKNHLMFSLLVRNSLCNRFVKVWFILHLFAPWSISFQSLSKPPLCTGILKVWTMKYFVHMMTFP